MLEIGKGEVLREGADCLLLALGATVYPSLEAAALLEQDGIQVTVVNSRFVAPLDEELIGTLARHHRCRGDGGGECRGRRLRQCGLGVSPYQGRAPPAGLLPRGPGALYGTWAAGSAAETIPPGRRGDCPAGAAGLAAGDFASGDRLIMERQRLDKALVSRGLALSRERAQALILAGAVVVEGQPQAKAGTMIPAEAAISLTHDPQPYVSRGGVKMERALAFFPIDPAGRVIMDVGASTGGFTDCLLQRGAGRIYAVDVGYGQLAWQLQQDPRVVNLQRRNIRYLTSEEVGEQVDLVVIDTSFISLELVIPAALRFLKAGGGLLALIKPQFEVGKGEVGKGGVVRDPEKHQQVIERISRFVAGKGLILHGVMESPLLGPKGNKEFFIYGELPNGKDSGTEAG